MGQVVTFAITFGILWWVARWIDRRGRMSETDLWISQGADEGDRVRDAAACSVNLATHCRFVPEPVLREMLRAMAEAPFPIPESRKTIESVSDGPDEPHELGACFCGSQGHRHGSGPPTCKAHCNTCDP